MEINLVGLAFDSSISENRMVVHVDTFLAMNELNHKVT